MVRSDSYDSAGRLSIILCRRFFLTLILICQLFFLLVVGVLLIFFKNPVGGSAHSEDALIPEVNYNQTRRGRGRENTPLIG